MNNPAAFTHSTNGGDEMSSAMMHYVKHNGMIPRLTKASPRFSEVNPQVGTIMSLNNRLQMNIAVGARPQFQIGYGAIEMNPTLYDGTEASRSDYNTVSSKYATAQRNLEPKLPPTGGGRNSQPHYQTMEVAIAKKKTSSQTQRKRASIELHQPPQVMFSNQEQQAMRALNPHAQKFEKLMSKVVQSVQNRRKQNFKFESDKDESQLMITTGNDDFSEERDVVMQALTSGEGRTNRLYLTNTGNSTGSIVSGEKQKFESTAEIVAAARQEQYSTRDTKNQFNQPRDNKTQSLVLMMAKERHPPRAVEQVAQLLNQIQQNKEKVFVPLQAESLNNGQAMIFKETKNSRIVESGNVVFSQNGFLKVAKTRNELTDFISKEQFIEDGVQGMILNNVPFFRKFHVMKSFKQWRHTMRQSYYNRTRAQLAQNFIFSKPIFVQRLKPLITKINETRFIELIEIRSKTIYGKGQQFTLQERCEKCLKISRETLHKVLVDVRQELEDLKKEIQNDDISYLKAVKNHHVQQMLKNKSNQQHLVMFSQAKQQQEEEEKQRLIMVHRQSQYNLLCQLVVRMIGSIVVESIYANKKEFAEVICEEKNKQPQFEIHMIVTNEGIIDSEPTIAEHRNMFKTLFQNMEDAVFKNTHLTFSLQDIPDLFFTEGQNSLKLHQAASQMRRIIPAMEEVLQNKYEYLYLDKKQKNKIIKKKTGVDFKRTTYKYFHNQINTQIETDISNLQKEIAKYYNVQEIFDFKKEWDLKQGIGRNDTDVYKETMKQMADFKKRIAELPEKNPRCGTITFECLSLKKQLQEIPKKITESIQHNFKGTMIEDTKALKEELSTLSDVLDQMPVSLNIYVSQNSMLKFADQKKEDFENKWITIQELFDECRTTGIKPGIELEYAVEEVKRLYEALPALKQKASDGLKSNKGKMEEIIKTSSMALSNKIKSFERQYVEHYMLDKARLEDCAETLEELLKRSNAIHEIRAKVILYKEFLKVLYENEPLSEQRLTEKSLSCVSDYENLQTIHKHTTRLWKYLLFWRKRRNMCYQTPFLQLDLNIIIGSIGRITRFFDTKLKECPIVAQKSTPLTKTIQNQVKETSVIVEFAKNLHKDALQRRHWIQIFTLLKAAHLKNSTTFTIVDLREYNIQNYSDEIKVIINYAHTESKYESVFLSIKSEWDKAELKIIPFKDQLKDYVISNTDTMTDAIEENLGTLETISGSKFAAHIKRDINDLEEMLKNMLKHLDKWVLAQKYWVTLDPIYNSGIFNSFFGDKTQSFLEVRSQFRRIMWSAYRNPKATYNLMIEERIKVFIKLIDFYEKLQKKVHEYLEQKRLAFTRFFFLNDSQFLDFLMLVSSNQDFSVYLNMMFQGAHKLFITQIKQTQHLKLFAREDSLGFEASVMDESKYHKSVMSDEDDIEVKLEQFMKHSLMITAEESIHESLKSPMLPALSQMSPGLRAGKNLSAALFQFDHHALDPIFKVQGGLLMEEDSDQESDKKQTIIEEDSDSLASSKELNDDGSSETSLKRHMDEINASQTEKEDVIKLQDLYALGLISFNKELFLFENHIQMTRKPEDWLQAVENSMKTSLKKQMKNSIERFGFQPIEEWCLDYPQQVSISVMHMVISQEINDQLAGITYDDEEEEMDASFFEDKVNIGQIPPELASKMNRKASASSIENAENEGTKEASVNSDKTKSKRGTSEYENFKQKVLRAKISRAPPMEEEEEKKQFFEDAFGEDIWPSIENIYEEAEASFKKEEARLSMKNLNAKKAALKTKKPEYKELMLNVLTHHGKHSLYLRITFWINKMMKQAFKPKRESLQHDQVNFDLQGVSKMQIKNIVLFLRYMQDMVERLINMKVSSVDDFEWQYKLKTNWNQKDEAEVNCGGWKMQMGYEYLATKQRLLITPLTERYFVFIASSLREKSSVMFQCIPEQQTASEIVEELACFAAVPWKTIHCGQHMNLSAITQLLNGCAMAKVWIYLEHMDTLPMVCLSILLKEIQLIHEQFAASQFQEALQRDQKNKMLSGISLGSNARLNQSGVDFGVFGSISSSLAIRHPDVAGSFIEQIKSTFRIITVFKPDLDFAFKGYLFIENFSDPIENSSMLNKIFSNFVKIKNDELYTPQTILDAVQDHFGYDHVRLGLKLACLLRNQEFEAFYESRLEYELKETLFTSQMDKFEARVKFSEFTQRWEIIKKTKADWIIQRKQKEARRTTILKEKNLIEFNAILEGCRVVAKQRFTNEWLTARKKNAEWLKRNQFDISVDVKVIESEIDQTLQKAFEEVHNQLKYPEKYEVKKSVQTEDDQQIDDDRKPPKPRKFTAKEIIRKESLMEFQPKQFHRAPTMKKTVSYVPGANLPLIKHSSHVDLRYAKNRQSVEHEISDKFQTNVIEIADKLGCALDESQLYNCHGILQNMRRTKGLIILGPSCSGKTQLMKIMSAAFQNAFNIKLKIAYVSPNTFSEKELYGPKLAFESNDSDIKNPHELQNSSVFQIILQNTEREKLDTDPVEAKRTIQSIYIDQQSITPDLTDCLVKYLRETNIRERDYQRETEFLLDLTNSKRKAQPGLSQKVAIRFPNGNVTMFPSDLYFIFETQSLENASPVFVSQVGIIHTQDCDVSKEALFTRQLKLMKEAKHEKMLKKNKIDFNLIEQCIQEFVLPFINILDKQPLIRQQCSLWNIKHQTNQFFILLNALIYRLNDNIELNRSNEDPYEYPFREMTKDCLWSCILVAVVWSFGAVLNKDMRRIFDEQFGQFKTKFNINFNQPLKGRFYLFDYFFDVERLSWGLITEKLEYRMKVHFDIHMQQIYLPTTEIAQAFFIQDHLVHCMDKDKDLNKHFRLIGPSSSSKTVILQTFSHKISTPVKTIQIPMSAYLTTTKLRKKIEENYTAKRKNFLIPKDPKKQLVLVIDDIHMQRNLKIEVLEFIRSWSIAKGYFDVPSGYFKKVEDFCTIMAENSEFVSTTKKQDRFMMMTTTLYCEEITIDKFKPFVQTWLTSSLWPQSQLVTRYYILISNSLISLCEKMKRNDSFFNSSFSKLIKFQYVAKFCQNIINNSQNTESSEVFQVDQRFNKRREEDAIADIFCYEIMRCFGDRIMRPSFRMEFMQKLAEICQKEFLCDKNYSPSYIESLTLGNYAIREPKGQMKLYNVTAPHSRMAATQMIIEKCKSLSGNQMLQSLLDSPNGLGDLFRICRVLFKEKQNLTLVGLPGTSKNELIQLCTLLNECICLEIDVPSFGKPVQFADAFKRALVAAAKLGSVPVIIQISDTQLRDPIYYDYVLNFMQHYAHFEEFVLFNSDLCDSLAQAEASYIRKLKKVAMPSFEVLWKQAAAKVRKNVHIIFTFSDLMSYKEIFQMFPQFEYLTEVIFLDDLAPHGYTAMVDSFLARSKIGIGFDNNEQNFSKALSDLRFKVKKQFLTSFYSQKMLKATVSEPCINFGAAEYVFPDDQKVTGNIFAGPGGFTVMDKDLRFTLMNIPLDVTAINKHRFGMFLELFRFLYDLVGMHLSIHKAYFETFIAKKIQFSNYYESVRKSKHDLHQGSSNHSFQEVQAREKIERIKQALQEKEKSIENKQKENIELSVDLEIFTQQIDDVITAKNIRLTSIIDELQGLPQSDFIIIVKDDDQPPQITAICNIVAVILKNDENAQMERYEAIDWFIHRTDDLVSELNHKRHSRTEFSDACFNALDKFIKDYNFTLYDENPVTRILYSYLIELFRKLNIKNTMESTYSQIREAKERADTNMFSIYFSQAQIEKSQKDLIDAKGAYEALSKGRVQLSRKIEEAEISYMRTENIYEKVMEYSKKIQVKLDSVQQRSQTLLGDCILMAASVTLLGYFSPEERESCRLELLSYLQKTRDIDCHNCWYPPVQTRNSKQQKSMFMLVMKDLGLKEILKREELPAVLSEHDFSEALFTVLFAPSCPVVADVTGEMETFIKEKFLGSLGVEKISGADIFGNEKLQNCLLQNRAAIITDVNFQRKINGGLSHDQQLFKRLSGTIYNGFDFTDVRTASLKKIHAITPFFSFYNSQNKRIQTFGNSLENISIYQAQIFQPTFDFLLSPDFTQNATFVCAAPSFIPNSKLDRNKAIITLKEVLLRNLLPSTQEFDEVRDKLLNLNARMSTLSQNFENSFLIASGETLKKLVDYQQLCNAVEDVTKAKEDRKELQAKYDEILTRIELLSEVSRILFQMFIALKLTSRVMNEVTYSWQHFMKIVEEILQSLVSKLKMAEARKHQKETWMNLTDPNEVIPLSQQVNIEIEIGKDFFREKLLPTIHKVIMSNVKLQTVNVFNLILSLRFSLMYETVTIKEYQFMFSQAIKLKEFWRWRDDEHQFVKLDETVEKSTLQELKSQLLQIYPDEGRKVFDFIDKRLGKEFTFQKASRVFQEEVQSKYNLSPLQMMMFGFICPDHEFKAKLTLFMYQQIESTFTFKEDVFGFTEFIKLAEWKDPIALFSFPNQNIVNLVTSVASKLGFALKVMRADPVSTAYNAKQQLEEETLNQTINDNLLDLANVRASLMSMDYAKLENLANETYIPKQVDQTLQKQNWLGIKQRNANLDEGSIIHDINFDRAEHEPVEKIAECAQNGTWVLICPVQFPQYTSKLFTKLALLRKSDLIHKDFRLIFDLQGLTQSEIPDSFLFDKSISFHIGKQNFDQMPTYNDIWSKILDPVYMNVLTNDSEGRQSIRNIEMMNQWGNLESENVTSIFSSRIKDQTQIETFKAYLTSQKQTYKEKLQKQQILTFMDRELKRKADEQKKAEAEEKQKKLLKEQIILENHKEDTESENESSPKDFKTDPTLSMRHNKPNLIGLKNSQDILVMSDNGTQMTMSMLASHNIQRQSSGTETRNFINDRSDEVRISQQSNIPLHLRRQQTVDVYEQNSMLLIEESKETVSEKQQETLKTDRAQSQKQPSEGNKDEDLTK